MCAEASENPDFGQRAGQFGGQCIVVFARFAKVGWGIFGFEIAPALKRAFGGRGGADQVRVQNDGTAADAVIANPFFKSDDALPGLKGPLTTQ